MCYTGLCPYEITSGPNAGECTISDDKYPNDAGCIQTEWEQEVTGLEEALREIDPPLDHEAYEAAKAQVKLWRERAQ